MADKEKVGRKILVIGGARSGKSNYAQSLAKSLGQNVLFIATSEPLDNEMKTRIKQHKRNRPRTWTTLELSHDIAGSFSMYNNSEVILIDCITLLVANIIGDRPEPNQAEAQVLQETNSIINMMNMLTAHFIIISNEVGLGIVPDNKLARIYRDLLGKVNQLLAQNVDEVYFMVAGLSLRIK